MKVYERPNEKSGCILGFREFRELLLQEGKVVVRMPLAIGMGRLLELRDDRVEEPELIEPVRQDVDAHQRQLGCHVDDGGFRDPARRRPRAARASLGSRVLPSGSPAVDLAQADLDWGLALGHLIEQHPSWTLRVVVENGPHEDLIDLAKLSTGINGWTWRLSEGTVAWGEVHDFLLFGIGLG
jgi:hypothetical protein